MFNITQQQQSSVMLNYCNMLTSIEFGIHEINISFGESMTR